jgi:cephalosporin hydroxylase
MMTVDDEAIVRRFHELYYGTQNKTWRDTYWLGVPLLKCPLDLWVYQELVYRLRPAYIVETGTHKGGSAYYLASLCDLLDHGRVLTIDTAFRGDRPRHPRIEYVTGSSVDPAVFGAVRGRVSGSDSTLVILDSDHDREHVLTELRMYAKLVTLGSYLVVEDTNLNGHPVRPDWGPGPGEAVDAFLAESPSYRRDPSVEKHLLTFHPGGYLVRVG